jgi:cytochrome P450
MSATETTETTETADLLDFESEQFLADPWPVYRHFRAEEPVHWSAQANAFVVFRHADVTTLLTDRRLISDFPMRTSRRLFGATLLDSDGAKHRELRQVFTPLFSGKAVRRLREEILVPAVAEALDSVEDPTEVDFLEQIAKTVPYGVATRLLGLPPGDAEWLRPRIIPMAGAIDFPPSPLPEARQGKAELTEYVTKLLADRRPHDRLTLLDLLLPPGEELDPGQLSTAILLLLAATETSVATIGTIMYSVLAHGVTPEELLDDDHRARIVRETLRWEPATHTVLRYAASTFEFGGVRIPKRAAVLLSVGSANRDEEAFADPDTWRPGRTETRSLAFGAGPHTCLGIHLATTEFDVLFQALASRYRAFRPSTALGALRGHIFRGPTSLRVQLEPRGEG